MSTVVRTRVKNGLTSKYEAGYKRWTNCSEPNWVPDGGYGYTYSGSYSSMTDRVVSKFKEQSSKGKIFMNPMSSRKYNYVNNSAGYYVRSKSITCSTYGWKGEYDRRHSNALPSMLPASWKTIVGGYTLPAATELISSSDINRGVSQAVTACLAKRGSGDANYLESLAEFKQVVGSPKNLLKTVSSLFSGNLHSIPRSTPYLNALTQLKAGTVKDVASLYLMWRYGIRPLVSDVQTAYDVYLGKYRQGPLRTTSRSRVVLSAQDYKEQACPYDVATTIVGADISHNVEIRAMSLDEMTHDVFTHVGLSAKNLIGLPWELTRLSFAVDWLINVGDLIYASIPTPQLKQLGACVVVKHTLVTQYSPVSTYITPGYTSIRELITPVSGSLIVTDSRTTRTPGLTGKALVVKSDFGFSKLTRTADAAAVLATLLMPVLVNGLKAKHKKSVAISKELEALKKGFWHLTPKEQMFVLKKIGAIKG